MVDYPWRTPVRRASDVQRRSAIRSSKRKRLFASDDPVVPNAEAAKPSRVQRTQDLRFVTQDRGSTALIVPSICDTMGVTFSCIPMQLAH